METILLLAAKFLIVAGGALLLLQLMRKRSAADRRWIVFRSWEGPYWLGVYVEHKDILGLTVRASAGNLLNARHRFDRVAYAGRRDEARVAFIQENNQLIGPIFELSVRGNF